MINTKRFYLRKFKITDAIAMFNNWASDDEVTKYLTWQTHRNVETSKSFIQYLIDKRIEANKIPESDNPKISEVKKIGKYTINTFCMNDSDLEFYIKKFYRGKYACSY